VTTPARLPRHVFGAAVMTAAALVSAGAVAGGLATHGGEFESPAFPNDPAATALASVAARSAGPSRGLDPAATIAARPASAPAYSSPAGAPSPQYPFYPYDGSITFVRIRTQGYFSRGRGGWSHDYPDAEINLFRIVSEISKVPVRLVPTGGNVLTFDDPRLALFPLAYVSEPGDWQTSPREAAALRDYLLRGGFVIFDDFFLREMDNLRTQMKVAFPELDFMPMDGTEPIWSTYFSIDPLKVDLQGPQKNGTPTFYALYEDNDPGKRMLAIANAGADIGDLWEWAAEGLFPVDPTNVAFQIGVNYLMYALTH